MTLLVDGVVPQPREFGFDDLFEQAKDEAKDDKSKPPNPFDMD